MRKLKNPNFPNGFGSVHEIGESRKEGMYRIQEFDVSKEKLTKERKAKITKAFAEYHLTVKKIDRTRKGHVRVWYNEQRWKGEVIMRAKPQTPRSVVRQFVGEDNVFAAFSDISYTKTKKKQRVKVITNVRIIPKNEHCEGPSAKKLTKLLKKNGFEPTQVLVFTHEVLVYFERPIEIIEK